jgi:hypothetical protein
MSGGGYLVRRRQGISPERESATKEQERRDHERSPSQGLRLGLHVLSVVMTDRGLESTVSPIGHHLATATGVVVVPMQKTTVDDEWSNGGSDSLAFAEAMAQRAAL